MKSSFFIVLILLVCCFSSAAYETNYVLAKDRVAMGDADNSIAKLVMKDPNIGLTVTPTYKYKVNLKYTRSQLSDVINKQAPLAATWDYTLTLILKLKDANGNFVGTTPSFNLTLNFKALTDPTTSIYEDVILYDNQYTWLNNPNAELFVTAISSSDITNVPADISLELTQIQSTLEPLNSNKDPLLNKSPNNKIISWDYINGAQWYELEWVYIDFYDGTNSFPVISDAFIYKEAVRISTSAQFFNFHNTYSKGSVYFRIRGATSDLNYTNWYYSSSTTIVNTSDFEPLINWQSSTVFLENGKYKKSIEFADGSTRSRQSQTSMNSDNTVIISETKYDFEGKPVINVMPFPYDSSTSMNYVPNVNTFTLPQGTHQKSAYDNQTASASMSNSSGASQYYSALNPFASSSSRSYTPDAQGYPYSQVIYTPDNTGRVAKASQVGDAFKIFKPTTGNEQNQHFTQNFYASPSSTELYRMFGSNVGQSSHYTKTYSVDENGVVSIVYNDAADKVIATALSDKSTNNLVSITDPYNQTSPAVYRLSDQNDVDVNAHVSMSVDKIVNLSGKPNGQLYTFKYDLSSSLDNQLGACLSCDYTFELKITGPDGISVIKDINDVIMPSYIQDLVPTVGNNCTSTTYPVITKQFTFDQIGEYTITKKLYYKTGSIAHVASTLGSAVPVTIMLDNKAYTDKTTFISAFVGQKQAEANCGFSCLTNCINYSNTFLNTLNPATGLMYTATEIAAIKSQCETTCGNDITNTMNSAASMKCAGYKQQMLDQLRPGGYYYEKAGFISGILANNNPVFNPVPVSESDVSDPVKFVSTWAEGLLSYHPEYCLYTHTCENTASMQALLNSSNTYDTYKFGNGDAMMGASSWSDAATKGFLRPVAGITIPSFTKYGISFNLNTVPSTKLDPFFTGYGQSISTFTTKLTGYYDETLPNNIDYNGDGDKADMLSAWEFASCYSRNSADGTLNTALPEDYNVRRWAIFKGIYLSEKDKFIQNIIKSGCGEYKDPTLPQTIIRVQPNFNQTTIDAWKNWSSSPDQASNICSDDVCIKRAESAFRELELVCSGLSTVTANHRGEVIYHLYKYFQDGCSTYNPQKLILSNTFDKEPLIRANAILSIYECSLNSIQTIRVNNDDCKIVLIDNGIAINPYLSDYVDIINDYLEANRNSIGANPAVDVFTASSINLNSIAFLPINSFPSGRANPVWQVSFVVGGISYQHSGISITQDPGTKKIQMFFKATDGSVFVAETGLLENIESVGLNLSSVKMIGNMQVKGVYNPSTNPKPIKYQAIPLTGQAYDLSIYGSPNQNGNGFFMAYTKITSAGVVFGNLGVTMFGEPITAKIYCSAIANTNPFYVDFNIETETDKCKDEQDTIAIAEANKMWDAAVEEQLQTALNTHYSGCFATPFKENFYYETTNPNQLYYTLYYYDQAGNLIQTVPPEGVRLLGSDAFNAKGEYLGTIQPTHGLLTKYKYNSLNQITYKITPDESGTNHDIPAYTFYNDKGQAVLSQNARQRPTNTFSCVSYDKLGRVSKGYDIVNATLLADLLDRSKYDQNAVNYWNADLFTAGNNPTDIIATTYDTPVGADPASRGRVTKVSRALNLSNLNASNLDSYISYQYDIHGNVKTLTNAMPLSQSFTGVEMAFTVDYTYDLLSGSVKKVMLDKGLTSQFMHTYCYDADNRLKTVKTSRNGLIWEEDARYQYYLHGPLARTELGEDRVQGTDYYSTLQGWIKGINIPAMQQTVTAGANSYNRSGVMDIGHDGGSGSNLYVAQDEYMMNLGFYAGDYTPIEIPIHYMPLGVTSETAVDKLWTSFNGSSNPLKGLYNGNIAFWINDRGRAIDGSYTFRDNAYVFKYDQLDRIRNAYYTTSLGYTSDYIWNLRDVSTPQLNDFNASYDLNGNIKTMQRRDPSNALIDNLTYNYNYVSGQSGVLLDNKLQKITDASSASMVSYDVDNQSATTNYTYDNIGNLIGDVSEQIANIGWNREGKVTSLTRTAGSSKPDFIFKYDVNGKRIYKEVKGKTAGVIDNTKTTYVYYAYDGTGNLLATYDQQVVSASVSNIRQIDANVFGSDRLGVYAHTTPVIRSVRNTGVLTNTSINATVFQRTPGYKQYELKDHLGNVRSVITGIKVGVDLNTDNKADFYVADVAAENDYYPFGMMINGGYRRTSTANYKFGYNGKPMDDDWNGNGAMYDYGFRIYDPRICKFLSVDPLAPSYPELTTYQFASNTPISCIDLDGLEKFYTVTGKLVWKYGTSTEIRIVNTNFVDKYYRISVTLGSLMANSRLGVAAPRGGIQDYHTFNGSSSSIAKTITNLPAVKPKPTSVNTAIPSVQDVALTGTGLALTAYEIEAQKLLNSSLGGGSTVAKPLNSPLVFSRAGLKESINGFRLIGYGFSAVSYLNTEDQFQTGQINDSRRMYNHMNNVVATRFPVAGIPIAIGDYYGQKYSKQIVNNVAMPGGYFFDPLVSTLTFIGLPTGVEKK